MELGAGIALSTLILTSGGVVLKWISRPALTKCSLHAGLEERLKAGDDTMGDLKAEAGATRRVVIRIAAHLKIPVSDIETELKDMLQ